MKIIFRFFVALLCIFSSSHNGFGQQFKYQAPLNQVNISGYYSIPISPQIAGRSYPNLRDLRLFDAYGQAVPYLIHRPVSSSSIDNYAAFQIINHSETTTKSAYTIDRKNLRNQSNIILRIANANVNKQIFVEGADNPNKWFAVQSVFTINPSLLSGNEVREATIQLPVTQYRFLRLTILDSLTGRIRILGIGYHTANNKQVQPIALPSPTISIPTDKTKPIKIHFDQPYPVYKITFDIVYNGYYYRECSLKLPANKVGNRPEFVSYAAFASYFGSNEIQLTGENQQDFFLNIVNNDNPPLKIIAAYGWQKPVNIIANLEVGKSYMLHYGNDSLQEPNYDLGHFKDQLNVELPICLTGEPIAKNIKSEVVKTPSFWSSKLFLWLGLGLIIAVLTIFSTKLLADMKTKN